MSISGLAGLVAWLSYMLVCFGLAEPAYAGLFGVVGGCLGVRVLATTGTRDTASRRLGWTALGVGSAAVLVFLVSLTFV